MLIFSKLKLSFNWRSWKLWILIIILAISIFFIYQSQQPAQGTIKVLSPSVVIGQKEEREESKWSQARQEIAQTISRREEEEGKKAGTGSYDGKYIFFQYPNSFELKTKETSPSGMLEKVILLGREVGSKKLTIIVSETNTISLEEISGVAARKLNTKLYIEKPVEVAGEKGILFEKKEKGLEQTIFFLKDKLLTTISLSSETVGQSLEHDIEIILKDLHWKK